MGFSCIYSICIRQMNILFIQSKNQKLKTYTKPFAVLGTEEI